MGVHAILAKSMSLLRQLLAAALGQGIQEPMLVPAFQIPVRVAAAAALTPPLEFQGLVARGL